MCTRPPSRTDPPPGPRTNRRAVRVAALALGTLAMIGCHGPAGPEPVVPVVAIEVAGADAPGEDAHLARQAALRDAAEVGMIGLLNAGAADVDDLAEEHDPLALLGTGTASPSSKFGPAIRGNSGVAVIQAGAGSGGLGSIGGGNGGLGSFGGGRGGGAGFGRGAVGVSRPSSSATASAPIVLGTLTQDDVQGVVRSHLNRLRSCYELGLVKNPALGGRVDVKFVIAKDGTVSQAATKSSTLNDASVEQCLVDRFARMVFPVPRGGGIAIVSYPLVFGTP